MIARIAMLDDLEITWRSGITARSLSVSSRWEATNLGLVHKQPSTAEAGISGKHAQTISTDRAGSLRQAPSGQRLSGRSSQSRADWD